MSEEAGEPAQLPPPRAATEEPPMEIHKPKPVHNWREFLSEIGVVVIGVCIAIGLEQSVEWLHWQSEVAIARKSLLAEVTAADAYYARRVANAPCVDQKLDKVAQMIDDVAAGQQPRPLISQFNNLGGPLSDNDWQAERSSQILTHFPRQELALMTRLYAQQSDIVDWNAQETNAWDGLAVLLDAPQKLGSTDLAQLRINYHLARRLAYIIALNAGRQLAVSNALGVKYPPPPPAPKDDHCNPASTQTKF
jgi:hypothetical protein